MNTSSPHKIRRRTFLYASKIFGVATLGSLLLGGCGFQPVYGTSTVGNDVLNDLAATNIIVVGGRQGQVLTNYLLDRFNPRGRPARPIYALKSEISVGGGGVGTQLDRTTQRQHITVTVNATLTAFGNTHEFVSTALSGYSTSESIYASTVARETAIERAMVTISDDLRVQIATFFEKRRLTGA